MMSLFGGEVRLTALLVYLVCALERNVCVCVKVCYRDHLAASNLLVVA